MNTRTFQKVVETILQTATPEYDALEIIDALKEIDWKPLLKMGGIVTCEMCSFCYDVCKKPSTWVCPRCDQKHLREYEKITYLLQREHKSEKTLTLQQWITTLDYFDWKCAYCLERQYTALDHFIPRHSLTGERGLTTVDNCVPCCRLCNNRKSNHHPDNVKLISAEVIERVHLYLKQF